MGNGERGIGNGEWGMGNGEWGTGNWEWGMAYQYVQRESRYLFLPLFPAVFKKIFLFLVSSSWNLL